MRKGNLRASSIEFPQNYPHNSKWKVKEWKEFNHGIGSAYPLDIWSDGNKIFYTESATNHMVLNGNTWEPQTLNIQGEYEGFAGRYVWTDGEHIYHSHKGVHHVLNGDTWEEKVWDGNNVNSVDSGYNTNGIWTDGTTIYCDYGHTIHYYLDGNTWRTMSWTMYPKQDDGYVSFDGKEVWSDGLNIYLSTNFGNSSEYRHYRLVDKEWKAITWKGVTDFTGDAVWSDSINVYCIAWNGEDYKNYVLNGGTWEEKTWDGVSAISSIWSDGANIYGISLPNYVDHVLEPAAPQLNPAALMWGMIMSR